MELFRTFPTPEPETSPRLAADRVAGQDDWLMQTVGPLYGEIADRTRAQDATLTRLYRPMIQEVKSRVLTQQQTLASFGPVPGASAVPVCDTKADPTCGGTLPPVDTVPPVVPLPLPPSPPPAGPCLGPGGLPWSDSPEGQAIIAAAQAAGQPLYPIPWDFGGQQCMAWVPLMLGVDPHTETPVLVGPCISADGSPYSYSDLVDCQLPTPTLPGVPPTVPPVVPTPPPVVPPVQPPAPPLYPPPPAGPLPPGCCPPSPVNVDVHVTIPPLIPPPPPPPPGHDPECTTAALAKGEDKCDTPVGSPSPKFSMDFCDWLAYQKIDTPRNVNAAPSITSALKNIPFIGPLIELAAGAWFTTPITRGEPADADSPQRKIINARTAEAAATWAGRITGADIPYHAMSATYLSQYLDPQRLPTLEQGIDLANRGLLDGDRQFTFLAKSNGMCERYASTLRYAARPRLGINDLTQLEQRGYVDRLTSEGEIKTLGYMQQSIDWSRKLNQSQIDSLGAMHAWWRGYVSEQQRDTLLSHQGWVDPAERELFVKTQAFVAPPSDAVRFAIKDAFDPNDLGREDKVKEFNEQIGLRETLKAAGIYPTTIITDAGKPLVCDWPLLYWITSYDEISPTQGSVALRRLRPDRIKRFPLANADGTVSFPQPMTMELYRRLLREHDYNPMWRDVLAAITSAEVGRIDLRRMYVNAAFGPPLFTGGFALDGFGRPSPTGRAEKEYVERFRDLGYVPEDAAQLAYAFVREYETGRRNKLNTRTLSVLCTNYKLGTVDRATLEREAGNLTLDPAFGVRFAALCDAEMSTALLKESVAGIKRQFFSGELSEATARRELAAIGLRPVRIDQLMSTWHHARVGPRRYANAQQLIQWYADGQQGRADTVNSIVNLGFEPEVARRMVRHAEIGEAARSAKESERIENARIRATERLQRLRDKEAREVTKAQETVLRRFLAGKSLRNLAAWFHEGSIGEADVRYALRLKWGDRADVERWIAHARQTGKPQKQEGET